MMRVKEQRPAPGTDSALINVSTQVQTSLRGPQSTSVQNKSSSSLGAV